MNLVAAVSIIVMVIAFLSSSSTMATAALRKSREQIGMVSEVENFMVGSM